MIFTFFQIYLESSLFRLFDLCHNCMEQYMSNFETCHFSETLCSKEMSPNSGTAFEYYPNVLWSSVVFSKYLWCKVEKIVAVLWLLSSNLMCLLIKSWNPACRIIEALCNADYLPLLCICHHLFILLSGAGDQGFIYTGWINGAFLNSGIVM